MSRSYRKTPIVIRTKGFSKQVKQKLSRRFRHHAKTQLELAVASSETADFDETLLPEKPFQIGRIPDKDKHVLTYEPESLSFFLYVYGK